MVQRVTLRTRKSYSTKSNGKRIIKTPGTFPLHFHPILFSRFPLLPLLLLPLYSTKSDGKDYCREQIKVEWG